MYLGAGSRPKKRARPRGTAGLRIAARFGRVHLTSAEYKGVLRSGELYPCNVLLHPSISITFTLPLGLSITLTLLMASMLLHHGTPDCHSLSPPRPIIPFTSPGHSHASRNTHMPSHCTLHGPISSIAEPEPLRFWRLREQSESLLQGWRKSNAQAAKRGKTNETLEQRERPKIAK